VSAIGHDDDLARNLAEAVDELLVTERSRDRRLALIAFQIRRALSRGYKAGIARASKPVLAALEHRISKGATPDERL
jgi:hypothetical protein